MRAKVVGSIHARTSNTNENSLTITPTVEFDYIEIIVPPYIESSSTTGAAVDASKTIVFNGGTGVAQMPASYNNKTTLVFVSISCSSSSIKFSLYSSSYNAAFNSTIVFYKYNS